MIKDFPPDFMHQGGGTMKKILEWILKGPRKSGNGKFCVRMSAGNVRILDERLLHMKQFIPNVFCRKVRPTSEVANYKYTELRQLLLYTGKILFLDLLACDEQYDNFLDYSVGCCLMVDPASARNQSDLHEEIMRSVVGGFAEVYGEAFMTYNAHVNLHFPAVAEHHGSLDSISAYPFENHLRSLKGMITSSHDPIASMFLASSAAPCQIS
jgi:hypothetical protein